jgi:molybdate transport system substrate-binding protein
VLLVTALVLSGCGASDERPTLDVLGAASLGPVLEQLTAGFQEEHDVTVRLSLAGSPDLVAQVLEGAPADVLVTADETTMARVTGDDTLRTSDPVIVATNTPALVATLRSGVATIDDAVAPEVRLVVCAPDVPCGVAARRLAEAAGVELRPVSEELQVTDVLAKVTSGEADAGIVYATDVIAAGEDADGVEIPAEINVVAAYPIVVTADAAAPDAAQEFVDFVLGTDGQAMLARAGFTGP